LDGLGVNRHKFVLAKAKAAAIASDNVDLRLEDVVCIAYQILTSIIEPEEPRISRVLLQSESSLTLTTRDGKPDSVN
jgi:hypothetical protein